MKHAVIVTLGSALCAASFAVPVSLQAAPAAAPYKAPRLSFGQPDLGGHWTNATLTPESRPASMGERRVMTPQEIAQAEGANLQEVVDGNQNIDPNKPIPAVGGDAPKPGTNPAYIAAGGAVGGYDRGWLEKGDSVMRVGGEARTSILTTPNGRAPARKAQAAPAAGGGRGGGGGGGGGQFDNPEVRPLGDRCLISFGRNAGPPMLPNGFYNNNYQIVQSKDAVVINVEMVHDNRIARLNASHRTDGVRPWFGDSIAWYAGDTLVIETTNMPQRMAYQGAWENLKVTEKFTRVAKDRLLYQFTIEDPTVWDKPWGGEYEFSPLRGIVAEYACHEGNYALEGILAGARNDERMAAQAGAAKR